MRKLKLSLLVFTVISPLAALSAAPAVQEKLNPRDPAIWQEKTPTPTARDMDEQCRRVRYAPCDYEQRTQTEAEREAERREINRAYNQIKNGEWKKARPR
ncbi:hypothetical protein ACP26C_20560 [Franconibacter helveticus 513]|uniref:hypothetical protein n=1 Tax=Franconibacter helveticus TaxID=357240 RepID=UPI00040D9772|nr:hypothetical protein [Franconibacter helveticus]